MSDLPLPEARTLAAARFVADYWRKHALSWGDQLSPGRLTAHPLCCVLAALDGERDPAQLGIDEAEHDAFHAALGDESGHRAVWSAEEVEPLIEAVAFYIEYVNEHEPPEYGSRDARMDDRARDALARVRGPEPESRPTRCPSCGSGGLYDPCPNEFHLRGAPRKG